MQHLPEVQLPTKPTGNVARDAYRLLSTLAATTPGQLAAHPLRDLLLDGVALLAVHLLGVVPRRDVGGASVVKCRVTTKIHC